MDRELTLKLYLYKILTRNGLTEEGYRLSYDENEVKCFLNISYGFYTLESIHVFDNKVVLLMDPKTLRGMN